MVLKSLILQGFKSFPDKTEIQFADGVTAIVGPNGSGKSNISDAIRWVLGEQSSRSLRGAKMEDIIFSGTTKRGPVGFAEVSLILDNVDRRFRSDFTEVMVTRRYYRSGDSEYYMNKQHCRLKDINEMFMDTGLGRDGYSVIGQGRIAEILSLKSEDRRDVFEEAAGITKFRYRKGEAERKLAATEENLVRIRDVYSELAAQKEPLEKQAEKARQYLLIRDELRVLEISLWLLRLTGIRTDAHKIGDDAQTCDAQLAQIRARQEALYSQSDTLTASMRTAEIELENLRGTLREAELRIADHASHSAVLETNIANNETNIARTRREGERQAEQAQSLDSQLAQRRALCAELDTKQESLLLQQADAAARADEQKNEAASAERAQRDAQTALDVCTAQRFELQLAQASAQSGLDSMDARRDTIEADIGGAAARLAAEEQAQTDLCAQLAACADTLAGAKNKLVGITLKAENRRVRVGELEAEGRRAAAAVTDCENRVRMLTEMQKDYEGFSRSVKMIMSRAEKGMAPGVHGPISALINVPDSFVTAIETALGAAASNIVVDSAQVGRDAIEYLKKNDGGRATLLPIDVIRPASLREQGMESTKGFCGVADTLVQCDARYRDIVASLLGRTAIVEDMDSALALARAFHNRFRIVTLDGQIIQAGGAMTGGSVSKSTGVLARAAKLRALDTQKTTLLAANEQAENAYLAALRDLSALDFDIKAIEAERARAQEDEARLTAHCQQHRVLLESLRTRQTALELERDNLSAARLGYEQTIAEKTEEMNRAAQEFLAIEGTMRAGETRLMAARARAESEADTRAQLSTAIAENRTEAGAERRALTDLQELAGNMTSTLREGADAIARFEAEIARLRDELLHADEYKQADNAHAERVRAEIVQTTGQRTLIEGKKVAADKEAHMQGETILRLERESGRLETRAVQLKTEETQIIDKMWETYELTPTPATEVARELPDIPQAERDAAEHKAKMRALGNVNLDAVDEYEKLMERYQFLGEQKDDLEAAERDLYKVIEELTVRMREIFGSEFAKLNAYFGETFREIFGGGHAELLLEDTSDILNCGIEIRVSPPGKALRTITLLSGGEMAFVAIALYFAIIKVRPTPFCVLDEIEAALDDVNVRRYAKYLQRLSDKTQFIAITHRRGTMEEADMLYGVTMQEQGISKLLMLNLAEASRGCK